MEVQVAALCDFAADYSGKLCALGVFDTIVAVQFPVQHPHCAIALRMLFRDEDRGQHKLCVSLIDDDGRNMLPNLEPSFDVQLPENMFFATSNMVFNLQGLQFKRPGQYSIDIALDGRMIARIPLQVVQASPQPPPA